MNSTRDRRLHTRAAGSGQARHSGITFEVENVVRATQPLRECKTHEAVQRLIEGPIESCCDYSDNVVAEVCHHPLMAAIHLAYAQHRPLVLSPDMIWITITQGLAHHVANNVERLQPLLVGHKGKATLRVERDDFVKGSPENPWPEVFTEFSEQIRGRVGDEIHSLLVCDFSTTEPVERAASEVVIMDVFRPYFDYEVELICGIPSVTLEGMVDDWRRLREKAAKLDRFDLGWWTRHLLPICDQFVRAVSGDVDVKHWQGLYKLRHTYGYPYLDGWICKLFPYLVGDAHGNVTKRNPLLEDKAEAAELDDDPSESRRRITSPELPTGLARVLVKWICGTDVDSLEFIAGFVGVTQDQETLALRPKIGWAVRQASGIEDLLSRIQREHDANPPRTGKDRARLRLGWFPGQLAQFYDACDGVGLFRVGQGYRYRIVRQSELRPPNLSLLKRGAIGEMYPSWLRFCVLDDESFYAVSLRDPSHSVWHWPSDSPSLDDVLTKVAGSVVELLQLILDSGGRYIHQDIDNDDPPPGTQAPNS